MLFKLNPSATTIRWKIKPIIHLLALIPFSLLVYGLVTNQLGVNPVEKMTDETGIWSLRFLLITLAISPLRQLTKMVWLTQLRRMLGLYAFFYGLSHFIVYFLFDQSLSLAYVWEDISERPFITVGFAALCIFVALACTSTNSVRRRMKRTWNRLHQGIYIAGLFILLHYLWLTRADYREPAIYVLIFILLMAFRIYPYLIKTARQN